MSDEDQDPSRDEPVARAADTGLPDDEALVSGAPVPDRVGHTETPGPGRGGPRFGPVGGVSGSIEPGRITADPSPVPGEVEAASSWPERDEWALPKSYGEDVVVAQVRDPWWVFVYWELSEATRAAARRRAGEGARFVLRLHEMGEKERLLSEVEVPDILVGDWYVRVAAPRLRIQAAMGFLGKVGGFHSVFESAEVPVPAFEAVPPLAPVVPVPEGEPVKPRPPEVELFEFSGGRELADAAQWRQQRTRPVLWKRRQVGGWKTLRDGGSGSGGFGMEMRFGPPEAETLPVSPSPSEAEELGGPFGAPLPGSDRPTSSMPSSPQSPFGRTYGREEDS